MIALGERFEHGVQGVIDENELPWHVTRLGCRVEYLFRPEAADHRQRRRGRRRPPARPPHPSVRAQPRRAPDAVPQHGADVAGDHRGRRRPPHRGLRRAREGAHTPVTVRPFLLGAPPWRAGWPCGGSAAARARPTSRCRLALPGDEIVAHPLWESTRAITIEAPSAGGLALDRPDGLPGLSCRLVHAVLARPAPVGDRGAERRAGSSPSCRSSQSATAFRTAATGRCFFDVVGLEPERALVLHSTRHVMRPMRSNEFTWAFVLRPRRRERDAPSHPRPRPHGAAARASAARAADLAWATSRTLR